MSPRTKKHEETNQEAEINLDKIISDYSGSKYHDTVIAMQWANHLKFTEEYRLKPMSEIIEKALSDVLSKTVKEEEVLEAVKKDEAIKLERMSEKKSERKEKKKKKDEE